jgi:hypothetical protein
MLDTSSPSAGALGSPLPPVPPFVTTAGPDACPTWLAIALRTAWDSNEAALDVEAQQAQDPTSDPSTQTAAIADARRNAIPMTPPLPGMREQASPRDVSRSNSENALSERAGYIACPGDAVKPIVRNISLVAIQDPRD